MEALRAAQSDWRCRLLDEPITRSGFSTWALRQCLPDIGLRNSKLPCDCGRLDAGFEGGTHCIQLASGHTRAILGGLLASLRLCISHWLLFRRAGRPSTATLGLGGDSRKQRIDFHIIQPLQCSSQVLRQDMALLRGRAVRSDLALWNSRRPGHRYSR
jgi:hypothetical protein